MNLAIIPARGGSKGVPRKNILPICGKPLIGWTIDAAKAARTVNRVVVSTDDPEIASVAKDFGAEVVWRPEEISGDSASSEEALLHVLEHLDNTENYKPKLLVFLQCTSPLTIAEDIDGTIEAMVESCADTALATTPFHYFLWKQNAQENAEGINHDKCIRQLRQERKSQLLETGAVYVMNARDFRREKTRFFGRTAMYVMPKERCLEIDDPVDIQVAAVLLRDMLKRQKINLLPKTIEAIVFDFDGVFTDNRVMVFQDGKEAVLCNRGDGMGIPLLKSSGIKLMVLSTEKNPVVVTRCKKLDIECINGVDNKLAILTNWQKKNKISLANTVYVGNDINDSMCLQAVGCGIVPADAYSSVKPLAHIILEHSGGLGAIREVVELVLEK